MKSPYLLLVVTGLLLTGSLFTPKIASADHGNGAGNGGAAILVNGQFCLLDLAQSGVCANPYTNPAMVPSAELLEKIRGFYPEITPKVAQLLGSKIVELKTINTPMALVLEYRLAHHKYFAVMSNGELRNPYFEKSPIRYEEMELYRLALRVEPLIYLSPYVFPKLSSAQKAATLFHELVSAVLEENGDTEITREFVSEIYKRGTPREIMLATLMKYSGKYAPFSWIRLQNRLDQNEIILLEYPERFLLVDPNATLDITTCQYDPSLSMGPYKATKLTNAAQKSRTELESAFQTACDQITPNKDPARNCGWATLSTIDPLVSEYAYARGTLVSIKAKLDSGWDTPHAPAGPDCPAQLMEQFDLLMGRN